MKSTFGEELLHFAQSVDNLDEANIDTLKDIIFDYLKGNLGLGFKNIELCLEEIIENKSALSFKWYSDDEQPTTRFIKNSDNTYFGQTAYSFDKNLSLWIVDETKRNLGEVDNKYLDLWNKTFDLPKFIEYSNFREIKTSIIIPIRKPRKVIGVLNLESNIYLNFNKTIAKELETISIAISLVLGIERTSKENQTNTQKALKTLKQLSKNSINLKPPTIFLSYPKSCDTSVIKSIRKVIEKNNIFASFEILDWNKIKKPGSIPQQIFEEIKSAKCGICYFSEKTLDTYSDNPNVLFEAGMLQALSESNNINWIPIREDSNIDTPFNFASDRILIVPRDPKLQLISDDFEHELFEMLSNLKIVKEININENPIQISANEIIIGNWQGKFNNGRRDHEITLQIRQKISGLYANGTICYFNGDQKTVITENFDIEKSKNKYHFYGTSYSYIEKGVEKDYSLDVFIFNSPSGNKLIGYGDDNIGAFKLELIKI